MHEYTVSQPDKLRMLQGAVFTLPDASPLVSSTSVARYFSAQLLPDFWRQLQLCPRHHNPRHLSQNRDYTVLELSVPDPGTSQSTFHSSGLN